MESVDERKNALVQWLDVVMPRSVYTIKPMVGDASFRRYFRVQQAKDTFVAMDAPPPQENCCSYVAISRALRHNGLNTPEILAENIEQGFLLLTDFGDLTYLKALNSTSCDQLYGRALRALAVLQGCREVPDRVIPPFTREWMWQEWEWHHEWFLSHLLGLPPVSARAELDACYAAIVDSALAQPQVFMHRDYHSANLMVLSNDVGILDFQDAFIGPVTYDLASLLRDCYIDWPEECVVKWVFEYWRLLTERGVLHAVTQQTFLQWFDWMGVQRHLKALFTFARKAVRDHQPQYLNHIPRTFHYLLQTTSRYPELNALHYYLNTTVKPAIERVMPVCAR